jgi:hypothetical protein
LIVAVRSKAGKPIAADALAILRFVVNLPNELDIVWR